MMAFNNQLTIIEVEAIKLVRLYNKRVAIGDFEPIVQCEEQLLALKRAIKMKRDYKKSSREDVQELLRVAEYNGNTWVRLFKKCQKGI